MENNKTREGKIYLNNKTGNLHLVIKDNITDKFLGNGTNYIVLREMSNLKK